MTINRNKWSQDDRDEFDELLADVIAQTRFTSERLDLMESGIADAIQAGRIWASEVETAAARQGYASEIKRFQDRNRALVSHDGQVLNVPRVQSRVVRTDSGESYHQRELIELWSWQQIEEKRREALTGRRTYNEKIGHYDRLLALRTMCPDAANPADAAKRLGIALDDWLAQPPKSAAA